LGGKFVGDFGLKEAAGRLDDEVHLRLSDVYTRPGMQKEKAQTKPAHWPAT
jgi:hypothetical protein